MNPYVLKPNNQVTVCSHHCTFLARPPLQMPLNCRAKLNSTSSISSSIGGGVSCWQPMRFAFIRPQPNDIAAAFRVLQASSSDSDKDLRKKYLDLVRQNHPDRGGSESKMKEITSSYDLLSSLSAQERKSFDESTRYASGAKRNTGSTTSSAGSHSRPSGYATNTTTERAKARKYQSAYDFQNTYRERYEKEQQKAYYAGQNANTGWRHGDAGFERPNPFQSSQMGRMVQQQVSAPIINSIMKGILLYIIVSSIFFSIYRSRLDEQHERGWSAQSRYAQADRGDRFTTDHANEYRTNIRDWDRSPFAYNDPRQQRVMDYAAKRARELKNADFASWPKLAEDGREGILFKRHQDPVGVTHYFPKPYPRPNDIPQACAVGLGGLKRQHSSVWFDAQSQQLGDHRAVDGITQQEMSDRNTAAAQEMAKHSELVHTPVPAQLPTASMNASYPKTPPPPPTRQTIPPSHNGQGSDHYPMWMTPAAMEARAVAEAARAGSLGSVAGYQAAVKQ